MDMGRQLTATSGIDKAASNLMPVIQELKDDAEPVIRQALVEQIAEIAPLFRNAGDEIYQRVVLQEMLPVVATLTTDSNPQVRQSAMEALVRVGAILDHSHIQPHLLPIVKSLAKDTTEEEHRVEGAQLLADLAEVMQASVCVSFAIPHIKQLATDPMFRVRKAVASNLGSICKIVGQEQTAQHLLDVYVNLTSDDIWGVRKACAESLVSISEAVTPEHRQDILTKAFERLAEDSSRWVRSAAFQVLGPFIATFVDSPVPENLLTYFKSMVADPTKDSNLSDSDNVAYCSFNFPAVLKTLGPQGWPQLSDTYGLLAKDGQFKVRRSLSFSLHEVAKILGTDLTEAALLPVLEAFLKDLEEVKVGAITHLAEFFGVLSPAVREEFLHVLDDIQKDTSWRFRKLLAKQLGDLSMLYSSDVVSDSVVPIFLALLQDTVVAVRKPLIKSLGKMIQSLDSTPEKRTKFVNQLRALATETHYQWRQLYAQLCLRAIEQLEPSVFQADFLAPLLSLAGDRVANVRFTVAKAFKRMTEIEKYAELKESTEVIEVFEKLKGDKDADVVFFLTGSLPPRLANYGVPTKKSGPMASSQ
eukprot:TRINITY_DN2473_c0_g1_i1.p1 TRINITY_DN2473_c0_g1~~TRINITY_DN2473_c0_g1_i1.p1  ORF type:complete len:587 (-),score=154.87 TRINITY_DN2473_c0_g1_i1:119-1879(-)